MKSSDYSIGYRKKSIDQLERMLNHHNVCWEKYQSVEELVKSDKDIYEKPIFKNGRKNWQVSGMRWSIRFQRCRKTSCLYWATLGKHTDEILADLLGLAKKIGAPS